MLSRLIKRLMVGFARTCAVLILSGTLGCDGAREFRAIAGDSIQSGIQSIATGLIDGFFAVIEPDATEVSAN